jgi:hypothetical protein
MSIELGDKFPEKLCQLSQTTEWLCKDDIPISKVIPTLSNPIKNDTFFLLVRQITAEGHTKNWKNIFSWEFSQTPMVHEC